MSTEPTFSQLTDTLSAPLGDLISAVGNGVAQAQQALDAQVLKQLEALNLNDDQTINNLRKIGYQPTWYQIPEASAEILMSLTLSGKNQGVKKQGSPVSIFAAPVNATYINSFDYDLKGFSKLSFKVVPVPPSTQASEVKIMPNIIHQEVENARLLLDQLNIDYWLSNEPAVEKQTIISASHRAGDVIVAGEKVVITHA